MSPVQAEGPYTVVVREPTVGYDVTVGADPIPERGMRVVSKRAFETLGQAQPYAARCVEIAAGMSVLSMDHDWLVAYHAAQALGEGGKVSLPDGTEIEVMRLTPGELLEECPSTYEGIPADPVHGRFNVPAIVAAFNAAQL